MKDALKPFLLTLGWCLVYCLVWLTSIIGNMLGSPRPGGPSKRPNLKPWHDHAKARLVSHFLILRSKIDSWLARRIRD